jgi:hypothetical protein
VAEVIDLSGCRLRIAAPVVHFEDVLVRDLAVRVSPCGVVGDDLDPEREVPGVRHSPQARVEGGVRDALLLEVADIHPLVHPRERRREAVGLLAVVVAVPAERAPVEELRPGDLEQVELGEAAVSLEGDGPAPE